MFTMSKTEVFNEVNQILGQTAFISDANTNMDRTAIIIRNSFNKELRKLIQKYAWNCYRSRIELELFKENPTKEWQYAYRYPLNAGNLLAISCDNIITDETFSKKQLMLPYKIERYDSNTIVVYTNVPHAWGIITYIPGENDGFDLNFGSALAASIAEKVAPAIITNNYFKIKDALIRDIRIIISDAVANDASLFPLHDTNTSEGVVFRNSFDY